MVIFVYLSIDFLSNIPCPSSTSALAKCWMMPRASRSCEAPSTCHTTSSIASRDLPSTKRQNPPGFPICNSSTFMSWIFQLSYGGRIYMCMYVYIYIYLICVLVIFTPKKSRRNIRSILEIFLPTSSPYTSPKKWWEKRITFAKDSHPVIQEFKKMSTLPKFNIAPENRRAIPKGK